ncbi:MULTISPECIES: NADP-dependent oxidoreductase [unclassified Nonomuraea]|uniref:NADP-dependent oxidoreductase n=1 Tax=unclassified Nonomuraea TaxID=2593643 RepID=UPI0033CA8BEF
MSKAIVFNTYGGTDVLELVNTEPPVPGPGQVRLRVRAAGVQPFDNLFRDGSAARYAPATFPQRLGNEAAGIVDAVGPGVTDFAVGDELLGPVTLAAFAEHAVADTEQLVRRPEWLPWEEAGALSASGQTAHTALRELGVGAGDTVLIHAAAGGVGHLAAQIAIAWGARVIGTAGAGNHDFLRTLGAEPVTYGPGLAERVRELGGRVDAALDCVATPDSLDASAELVKDPDRVGTIAFSPLANERGVRRLGTSRSAERLAELLELGIRVSVQATYPLERTAAACEAVESGHVRGKVVVTP